MNQPSKPKMLAAFVGVVSVYLSMASCTTTSTTTTPSTESSTVAGSTKPDTKDTTTSGGDANPLTVGLEKSDRKDADPLQLIQSDQLKKELNITAEQSAQLKTVENDLRTKVSAKNASVTPQLKGLDAKGKEEKLKAVAKEIETETKSSRESISKILKPDQVKRLKEIFLQIYGFGTLTRADFQQDLKLTDAQNKQFDTLSDQMAQDMRTSWEIPSDDPTKAAATLTSNRKRMEGIMKNSNAKSLEVLTADQKKTLEALKGKPFIFKPTQADK
jgi:hypothetical protein